MRRKFLIKCELYDTSFCAIYKRFRYELSLMCLWEFSRSLWAEYLIDKTVQICFGVFNPIWINFKLDLLFFTRMKQPSLIELRRKNVLELDIVNERLEECQRQWKSISSRFPSSYTCANMALKVAWETRRQSYDVIFEQCQMEFRQNIAKKRTRMKQSFKYSNEAIVSLS